MFTQKLGHLLMAGNNQNIHHLMTGETINNIHTVKCYLAICGCRNLENTLNVESQIQKDTRIGPKVEEGWVDMTEAHSTRMEISR